MKLMDPTAKDFVSTVSIAQVSICVFNVTSPLPLRIRALRVADLCALDHHRGRARDACLDGERAPLRLAEREPKSRFPCNLI